MVNSENKYDMVIVFVLNWAIFSHYKVMNGNIYFKTERLEPRVAMGMSWQGHASSFLTKILVPSLKEVNPFFPQILWFAYLR